MDRITQTYMDAFLKSEGIQEKKLSKQFELFAAYCVVGQIYSENYCLDEIIVGDGGDCGIDSIAIIVNGTLVTSKEEVEDLLEASQNFSELIFIFAQAKTASSFDSGEMGTFAEGVKDFFSEAPQMVRNQAVKDKSEIVDYIIANATKIKSKPICYLYYVTTGKWVDDQNCTARISIGKNDLQALNLFERVEYIPVDANLLQKFYRSTIDIIEREIEFSQKVLLPEIPGVTQAYLGYIDAQSYLKLITGDSGEILRSVFYDNVRDFQGDNPVNQEISKTVTTEPVHFLLYNNGVTIICKKLSSIRNNYILSGYQIVNGCQTSHVLFNNRDSNIDDIQIPVKLIETEDDNIVNCIIKATNRQTAVSDEQLIALNEFHRRLEEYYNTFSGANRLYYERRSKQYCYGTDIEKVRIVSISTQIKSVAAMFFDRPHLSSRYYGKLLSSINDLFSENHQLIVYYTSALTLYRLDFLFRNKLLPARYRKFRYFLLMMIKYDIVIEKTPPLNSNKVEKLCNKILEIVSDNTNLIGEINKLLPLIDKNVDDIASTESTKSATLVEKLKNEFKQHPTLTDGQNV